MLDAQWDATPVSSRLSFLIKKQQLLGRPFKDGEVRKVAKAEEMKKG